MDQAVVPVLELEDIQSGVLRPRPNPYAAVYILLRIDEAEAGRELMRRLAGAVTPAAAPERAGYDTFVTVALTYEGLKALGLPSRSLETFSWEFRQGMAARAKALGDVGESGPEHWESPLGSPAVHVVLTGVAPDEARLEAALARGREAFADLPGVVPIWRQDCRAPPDHKEPFGFRDGISHPAIEGSGIPGDNPLEAPLKAGELVLGYRRRDGALSAGAAAGRSRPQRDLRRLPQTAPGRRRLPQLSAGRRFRAGGRRTGGREDDGPLAQRRAPGALSPA